MKPLSRLSIRRKLVAMIMATAAVVLVVASTGYLYTDYVRVRNNLVDETRVQMLVLADSAAVAVSFNDEESAREILQTLYYRPTVRAACLYDLTGTLFSQYRTEGSQPCPDAPAQQTFRWEGGRLHLSEPAAHRGEHHGTLYVRSDVTHLERRFREQALVATGLLLLALALALPLSARLQAIVSDPIRDLARTAGDISARGDYSLRAARTTGDEIGLLVDDFNRMVERIQHRDAELSKANEDLRREIAERRRAEEERAALLVREREANRVKDEFLATLSHELRTPLNAILGWTKLLRTHAVPPGEVDRALEKVERNAQAQTRLIEDLLEVSRLVSGKLRLEARGLDLAAIVGTAIETIRPTAEARGVAIDRDFEPPSLPTAGDPDRLQQVAWNLLSNAVKFTPAGGRVTVRLRRLGGEDELVVTDTGIGIAPEFLPHVFDTFRQADASATRLHGGLGLGLSIVRQLVEMHGGRVAADSAGPRRGASFTVHLPVRTVPDHPPPPPGRLGAGDPLAGRTVVVVDDDEDTRDLLTSMVRRAGGTVVAAASAREGLGACLEHRPDVLISDIAMPGEDGYGLMAQLKGALGAQAPRVTIALTAFAGPRDRARTSDAGFQAHVAKPFDPAELIGVITELLEA
jgi:signal transduction histidine kinase